MDFGVGRLPCQYAFSFNKWETAANAARKVKGEKLFCGHSIINNNSFMRPAHIRGRTRRENVAVNVFSFVDLFVTMTRGLHLRGGRSFVGRRNAISFSR